MRHTILAWETISFPFSFLFLFAFPSFTLERHTDIMITATSYPERKQRPFTDIAMATADPFCLAFIGNPQTNTPLYAPAMCYNAQYMSTNNTIYQQPPQ